MAESVNMSLNHVLCFIFSKLHKSDENSAKKSILHFYFSHDIHAAKELLMSIVSNLTNFTKSSNVHERRDADGRAQRELDDIYTILHELDEKNMLQLFPKFVSDCPDLMPTSQLVEGDLRAVTVKFDKLEQSMSLMQQSFNSISAAMSINSVGAQGQVKVQSTNTTAGGNNKSSQQSHNTLMNEAVQYSLGSLAAQRVWADAATTSDTGESSAGGGWTSAGRRGKRRVTKSNQQTNGSPITSQPSITENNCTTINIPPAGMEANKNTSYASVAGKPANKPVIRPQFKSIVGRSRTVQNNSGNQVGHISAAKLGNVLY
jgi:hypothetical protein